jgi:hypothetical protein
MGYNFYATRKGLLGAGFMDSGLDRILARIRFVLVPETPAMRDDKQKH